MRETQSFNQLLTFQNIRHVSVHIGIKFESGAQMCALDLSGHYQHKTSKTIKPRSKTASYSAQPALNTRPFRRNWEEERRKQHWKLLECPLETVIWSK